MCYVTQADSVRLYMESFTVDQLDVALEVIKKEVTLVPGRIYEVTGFGGNVKKDLIETKLGIRYVNVLVLPSLYL